MTFAFVFPSHRDALRAFKVETFHEGKPQQTVSRRNESPYPLTNPNPVIPVTERDEDPYFLLRILMHNHSIERLDSKKNIYLRSISVRIGELCVRLKAVLKSDNNRLFGILADFFYIRRNATIFPKFSLFLQIAQTLFFSVERMLFCLAVNIDRYDVIDLYG